MIQSLDDVLRLVRMVPEERFVRDFPMPALTLWVPDPRYGNAASAESALQTTMEDDDFAGLVAISTGRNRVGWLKKSGNNVFQNIISVGRASTNDLQLPLDTISKIHAVFTQIGSRWRVTDQGATNGVSVNGAVVAPGTSCELKDGDILRFGKEVEATFHTPTGLYRFLSLRT